MSTPHILRTEFRLVADVCDRQGECRCTGDPGSIARCRWSRRHVRSFTSLDELERYADRIEPEART